MTEVTLPNVPPLIAVLLAEGLNEVVSSDELKKKLARAGFLRELRDQAEYTLRNWPYEGAHPSEPKGQFVFTASGALNPFSDIGKCVDPHCRLRSADAFARSLGLYPDYTVVPDPFTELFANANNTLQDIGSSGFRMGRG